MDWRDFDEVKSRDVCIATLCPGSGSPESLERMERVARRHCVLVSWIMNHGDDLNSEIWHRLGKDYGYGFRSSTAVQDHLKKEGREPVVEFFRTHVAMDIPLGTLVAQERSVFRAYGVDVDVGPIVEDILRDRLDDGVLHYSAENEMKMIIWRPAGQVPAR